MDGGLLQLIAKGVEDYPLTNKPEITPFKKTYRRTSIFSIMDSDVLLDDLSFNKSKLCLIPKIGDLISKVYLELCIPDFVVEKYKYTSSSEEVFVDKNYEIKKTILKKLLEIEDLESLKIDDDNIINLSANSLAKNILLAKKKNISNTVELYLDYNNNYEIVSYLLTSNLKENDIILADFLLRYLEIENLRLKTSSDYLTELYEKVYDDLIKNYYDYLPSLNSKDYQLNENIINEINNYLYSNELSGDLEHIKNLLDKEPVEFLKDNLETEINILKNLVNFIFSKDNFRNGNLDDQITLPFILYLYYDVNNNNSLKYDLTDKKLVSSTFIKDNIKKFQNKTNTETPIIREILNTFEKIKVESENFFESVGYQKILGNLPLKTLSILLAIEEIWKWQVFDFSNTTTINTTDYQVIPGFEILNLTQVNLDTTINLNTYIEALTLFKDLTSSDILTESSKEYKIKRGLTIDFERKLKLFVSSTSDPDGVTQNDITNLDSVIEMVMNEIVNVKPYEGVSNNSSYLNRMSKDLSLILVYVFHLFRNDVVSKNIFKVNKSHSWVNFMNEVICSKMYAKWYSEFTSRMDSSYVGPEVYLESTGEVGLKLEDKIPLSILPNNLYQLTSLRIKELIRLQTHKFNYIVNIPSILNLSTLNSYNLRSVKRFSNINVSIKLENGINFLVLDDNIVNIWYHNYSNEYYLVCKEIIIKLEYGSIRNNKIYFYIEDKIDLDSLNVEYLQVNINSNIRLSDNNPIININTLTTKTFTSNELEFNFIYKIFYDKLGNIIDLINIPGEKLLIDNTLTIDSNYTLENEPEHETSEIKYVNQLELPNYINDYNFSKDYYSYNKYNESNIGINYGKTVVANVDNYYKYSYRHHEMVVERENDDTQCLIYRLSYKINSQEYNGISVSCDNFYNNERISILGRFGNNFNLRENKDTDTLHCYSEGIDFYDFKLDSIKLNNIKKITNNEDDYLNNVSDILVNYYEEKEKQYKNIIEGNDLINRNFLNKFVDCLENISNIGPIYNKIINDLLEKNDLSIKKIRYFVGNRLQDTNYWASQIEITTEYKYLQDFFTKEELDMTPYGSTWINRNEFDYNPALIEKKNYIPNNILNNSIIYIDEIAKNIILQLLNIESNIDIINRYPRISKSLLKRYEIENIVNRNFGNIIESNLYEYKTKSEIVGDIVYYNNNLIEMSGNDIKSENILDDIDNSVNYRILNKDASVYPICFYDYGLTINNRVILLPDNLSDNDNNYKILKDDSSETGLLYSEINNNFILFDVSNNYTDIIDVVNNNLVILKDNNNNLLPYGKLYPDISNSYKFYRLHSGEKIKEKLIFENNLIESYSKRENIIFIKDFTDTTKIINPIYHSNNLKLEYYNKSYSISSNTFSLTSELNLDKFDFIYLLDENKWKMFDSSLNINIDDITSSKFYIFRFISNTIRNFDIFGSSYNFSEINLDNMILLCDKLDLLEIENNKIKNTEYGKLKEGDIILKQIQSIGGVAMEDELVEYIYTYEASQVIRNNNNILEIYPDITFSDKPRVLRNIYFNDSISNITSSVNFSHNSYSFTLKFLLNYTFYELPLIPYSNPWKYRTVYNGDLYYINNSLERATTTLTDNWVYNSIDNFVSFTNDVGLWYEVNSQNIHVGDIIIDLNKLDLDTYKTNPDTYLHTGNVLGRVLGRKGKYVLLDTLISDDEYLVKSYPIIIKPSLKELDNKLYEIDNENIILEKYILNAVGINEKKYLVDVNSNMLTINIGYDNSLKSELIFNKSLIYPGQLILLDNKWNRIKDYNNLELEYSVEDKSSIILRIPDIEERVYISVFDNDVINKNDIIDSLNENESVFCSIILFDRYYINNITYCDNLYLEKKELNILTFKYSNNGLEELLLEIYKNESDIDYFSNIYLNINNRLLVSVRFSLDDNIIYGIVGEPSVELELIMERVNNNSHIHMLSSIILDGYYLESDSAIFDRYTLSSQKLDKRVMDNRRCNIKLYNGELRKVYDSLLDIIIPTDFVLEKNKLYYDDIKYNELIKYTGELISLKEYNKISLLFDGNIERENNEYKIKLSGYTLNSLDDNIIYQIIENKRVKMRISSDDTNIYLYSENEIMLNNNFYCEKSHNLEYLREKLENREGVIPKNREYFHYRIGFREFTKTSLKIVDYLNPWDFDFYKNVEMLLNTNLKYYFDNTNLEVLNINRDLITYLPTTDSSELELNKETKVLEIPSNNYNFDDYDKFFLVDGSILNDGKQGDLLVLNEYKNVSYPLLIKNELGVESSRSVMYLRDNYLLVKVINELDYKKIIDLSNDRGINLVDDIFYNTYTDINDYNLYKDISLDLEKQQKHNNILEITGNIYDLISQWILLDEFKEDPDKYLNMYLGSNYNLKYNKKFYNLDDSVYLDAIPTYFKISEIDSSLYLEYIVKKENIDNNYNYSLFSRLLNDDSSHNLGKSLSNMVNFYNFWDKLKLGLSIDINVEEIYLSKSNINLKLERIFKKQILDVFNKKICDGVLENDEYNLENIFEYLVDLTSLPDNSELYYVDFKKRDLIFDDVELEYNIPNKQSSRLFFNKYLQNQEIDLYGKIIYNILSSEYLGTQYIITLPSNSLPSQHFEIEINNIDINYSNDINLVITYDDLSEIKYIRIKVKVPVSVSKGKYYINSNIKSWLDENTFVSINGELEELLISDLEIILPKPKSSIITLVKEVKILSSINLNKYSYNLVLDKDFNNEPSLGYSVNSSDLEISNTKCVDYQLKNSKLCLTFDKKLLKLENVIQIFRVNYGKSVSIDMDDTNKTVLDFVDNNSLNILNNLSLKVMDKLDNEIGNYIYSVKTNILVEINSSIYYNNNNKIELLGKLIGDNINGYYLVSIDNLHIDNKVMNITDVFELNNNSIIILSDIKYLMENNKKIEDNSYKIDDLINEDFNFNIFNLYLEEEMINELLKNESIRNISYINENLSESRYSDVINREIETEVPKFKNGFGYDILKNMSVKLHNSEIEFFDNRMFRDYVYYFIKKEKQGLIDKMLENKSKLIIPLPFWFCRNWSNSLPIIASNESKFYIDLNFNSLDSILENKNILNNVKMTGKLVYQTIWLDESERSLIGKYKQDYLIETFSRSQIEKIYSPSQEIILDLNGAVKDFFFSFYLDEDVLNYFSETKSVDTKLEVYNNLSESELNNIKDLVDSSVFDEYKSLLDFYVKYCDDKYYIGYLIIELLNIKSSMKRSEINNNLLIYFSKYYGKELEEKFYPLASCSMNLGSYQYIRNKCNIFWSVKNQLCYENSGNLGCYGYNYSLYGLSLNPSGHLNHNLLDSNLLIDMNMDYYKKCIENNRSIVMEIWYRKYRLLRFMGNQAGILW